MPITGVLQRTLGTTMTNKKANDQAYVKAYFSDLRECLLGQIPTESLVDMADACQKANKVLIIGNGGSSAIASHLAIDFGRTAGIPAISFTDAATITCLANDFGYQEWCSQAIEMHGSAGDLLVAISSSGSSMNIINGVKKARELGISSCTLSGFDATNPLRQCGDVNLWLDSDNYNIVETIHQFWLMSVVELIARRKQKSAQIE